MHVKCKNCGIVFGSRCCPNCGMPAQESLPIQTNHPTDHQVRPKRKKRVDGAIVYYLLGFAVLIAILINFPNKPDALNKDTTTSSNKTEFQKIAKTSPEQEEDILEILEECGIDKIDNIEHDELLDNINKENERGYRISSGGINNIILYLNSNNTVNIIRYADNNLYAKKKAISTIQDYTFTLDEQSNLQISCEKAVKGILKSPSTAKFPNITKWVFGKENERIIVQSYVDSQNSFGAELRSEFQFILLAKDYNVESFIFDGEELINK